MPIAGNFIILICGFILGAAWMMYFGSGSSGCRLCFIQWIYDIRYKWIQGFRHE